MFRAPDRSAARSSQRTKSFRQDTKCNKLGTSRNDQETKLHHSKTWTDIAD
jgi:hypothetical protein